MKHLNQNIVKNLEKQQFWPHHAGTLRFQTMLISSHIFLDYGWIYIITDLIFYPNAKTLNNMIKLEFHMEKWHITIAIRISQRWQRQLKLYS